MKGRGGGYRWGEGEGGTGEGKGRGYRWKEVEGGYRRKGVAGNRGRGGRGGGRVLADYEVGGYNSCVCGSD